MSISNTLYHSNPSHGLKQPNNSIQIKVIRDLNYVMNEVKEKYLNDVKHPP